MQKTILYESLVREIYTQFANHTMLHDTLPHVAQTAVAMTLIG